MPIIKCIACGENNADDEVSSICEECLKDNEPEIVQPAQEFPEEGHTDIVEEHVVLPPSGYADNLIPDLVTVLQGVNNDRVRSRAASRLYEELARVQQDRPDLILTLAQVRLVDGNRAAVVDEIKNALGYCANHDWRPFPERESKKFCCTQCEAQTVYPAEDSVEA